MRVNLASCSKFLILLATSTTLLALKSCTTTNDFSNIPRIEKIEISKTEVVQGSINNDSILLIIHFTDGDGDFGSDTQENIFIEDSRTKTLVSAYKAPKVPEQGSGNGIAGKIWVTVYSSCCITPQNPNCCLDNFGCPPFNELSYKVSIRDRGGNNSNSVQSPTIRLLCSL